ncbi:MAG: AmmeMemoRadiSam system protein B, partial [Deltaproteobacteria bacterium]|nr:AmmeMemoRadiSam system protein B [Deltaproteobacteria bacterium]
MQVVIRKASILAVGCCFMLLLTQSCCSEEAREPERRRPAAHAGRFYPADPQRLTAMLAGMLEQAGDERRRRPLAVIVPHAGYVYSGQTAARAYRLLQGSAVKRIILLAPSHYASVKGIVINAQAYETPLGVYRLDRQALELLQRQPFPGAVSRIAGSQEHSDEVQIPFLQSVLPDARLVPLIVGDLTEAQLGQAARAVQAIIDEQTVIVASS